MLLLSGNTTTGSIGMQAMDHIFPSSQPGVGCMEERCQFEFTRGWAWLQAEGLGTERKPCS